MSIAGSVQPSRQACKLKRMLKNIVLQFGSGPDSDALSFQPGAVTIFVGPNNSGKSLVLQEIETFVSTAGQVGRKVLHRIDPEPLTPMQARELLEEREADPPAGQGMVGSNQTFVVGTGGLAYAHGGGAWIFKQQVLDEFGYIANGTQFTPDAIFRFFVSLFTVRLDGKTRFDLTEERQITDLQGPPINHLMALFKNPEARRRIRKITWNAFQRYFVLDATNMGHLRIRFSKREPQDSSEEQNWDDRAQAFHAAATDIRDLSDGMKAFTGLVAALLSADHRVMLIDEPEAFLHPILAGKLGATITNLASERDANVLASTHSADFLMECVESGDVNVVRLTYRDERATARHLASADLKQMMRDPLLRSTGVLSGLFHEGVVVCEQDGDRALYQEVNHRLSLNGRGSAENALFLNAYEKSTVHRIVGPLRRMGIPAAAVVDLDMIKQKDLNQLMRAASVPQSMIDALAVQKSRIEDKFDELDVDMKKTGIDALPGPDKDSAQVLIDNLAQYGIFVVPVGALEQWFPQLRSRGDRPTKSRWVPWVFGLMSAEPELFPIDNKDVWSFVKKVAAWIANPERKGIPK